MSLDYPASVAYPVSLDYLASVDYLASLAYPASVDYLASLVYLASLAKSGLPSERQLGTVVRIRYRGYVAPILAINQFITFVYTSTTVGTARY